MCRESKSISISNKQEGSILITTLLILVVLNLMAVGLMQTSVKESKLATYEVIDSGVFHLTNSCIHDTIKWLTTQSSPPTTTPYVITEENLSHMYTGNETQTELTKLSGYSYSCTTTDITVVSVPGDDIGTGDEIGESGGYGAAGDLSPRYYYQVVSNALGPQNSTNTIFAIVSAEF
jgi:Tfp pilus assembly protein PilX